MNKLSLIAGATVAALLGTTVAVTAHAAPLGLAQVEQKLRDAGYSRIHEIEKDDGLWEADVTRDDGRFREVYVDPKTGEIFDEFDGRTQLNIDRLLAKAKEQGLKDIHSVERDGATWQLEARNARNQKVDVRLSGHDGRILDSERDGWLD
ncbi:PepSY domain-containing protein [Stenotrophomonas lacuserhaii]|uniref:PepSY domain-containing protein n=1 Tax=Stenotrophomonas lacuserhaii TaxID=2760084 RepID=UPI0015F94773|nr:PepSY domain-containing protein [Stenotrophomonas lacuserhaii]